MFDYVEKGKFSEMTSLFIVKQIIRGVLYMHGRGVFHLDLKFENILIDGKLYMWNKKYWVKICDLGLAETFEGN